MGTCAQDIVMEIKTMICIADAAVKTPMVTPVASARPYLVSNHTPGRLHPWKNREHREERSFIQRQPRLGDVFFFLFMRWR